MPDAPRYLWLIPIFPLLAAAVTAVLPRRCKTLSAGAAIGAMGLSFAVACVAFLASLRHGHGETVQLVHNFAWLQFGTETLRLGCVLDPLSAIMAVMVTFVGALIFIYSVGYMAHDENFTRFFCFLSLFAAAMLGLVIANSLLLLFMSWELVGLASYLLIGFWFHKPSAAAAAKKAFIVTRIGDLGLFIGMVWLYSQTGTLLFYDNGAGCLEASALGKLVSQTTIAGMGVATAISLLIFWGAMGKSGQVPLHVWLPDAMEGPTPVSALIHAATMVAAGVFLVARVYPLLDVDPAQAVGSSSALTVVAWIGAVTAVFAALIAVAQFDIKRILAYSTVSQLGYMMLGIGVGGFAVGMFHLITHAFFKALLFMGAGSVIHGCHERQDIREMGGLRKSMPVTFATYAIGMMALAGVPLFFSGFWSKDEILYSASKWSVSRWPFYMGLAGAFLTAFYMTRQVWYVFFAPARHHDEEPHESPSVMTIPLIMLAVGTVLLSFIGTPLWPWFHGYVTGHLDHAHFGWGFTPDMLRLMLLSSCIVGLAILFAWTLYNRSPETVNTEPLEQLQPDLFALLRDKFFVDELYSYTVVRWNAWLSRVADLMDRFVWNGAVNLIAYLIIGLSWLNRMIDEMVVNLGFDRGCGSMRGGGKLFSFLQNGQIHSYLRMLALAVLVLALCLVWGCQ